MVYANVQLITEKGQNSEKTTPEIITEMDVETLVMVISVLGEGLLYSLGFSVLKKANTYLRGKILLSPSEI